MLVPLRLSLSSPKEVEENSRCTHTWAPARCDKTTATTIIVITFILDEDGGRNKDKGSGANSVAGTIYQLHIIIYVYAYGIIYAACALSRRREHWRPERPGRRKAQVRRDTRPPHPQLFAVFSLSRRIVFFFPSISLSRSSTPAAPAEQQQLLRNARPTPLPLLSHPLTHCFSLVVRASFTLFSSSSTSASATSSSPSSFLLFSSRARNVNNNYNSPSSNHPRPEKRKKK